MKVCPTCFGESTALKARFDAAGSAGTCPTCGGDDVPVLEASGLADLFDGMKAHYEPLCGNPYRLGNDGIYGIGPDSGDDSLVEVLREDWEVFSDRITDEQAEEILGCVWPNYSGEYLCRPSKRWREVETRIDEMKEMLQQPAAASQDQQLAGALRKLLDPWVELLGSELTNLSWARARIQEARGAIHRGPDIGAPPAEKARAGRANATGVRFLYVASDETTAVAEVRAEPGDWVTVAAVEISKRSSPVLDLTRDVRIVDPFAHTDLGEALMVREFLQNFAYELSRPVRAKDSAAEYVFTQAIAAYFRDNGHAGIIFPSSLSRGTNAVFFDPEKAMIDNPVERAVWSKALDVVDDREFDRRGRQRKGLPY